MISGFKLRSVLIALTSIMWMTSDIRSQNHVMENHEFSTSGEINLETSFEWTTARTQFPGYFTAIGPASFINPSDDHHINGYVKHIATSVDQAFSFPVGDGSSIRTLMINGQRAEGSIVATAWIAGDPTTTAVPTQDGPGFHPVDQFDTGLAGVSNEGQWDWLDLSGDAAGLTIVVSIPDLSNFAEDADHLRLVGWDADTEMWVDLSGQPTATGLSDGNLLSGEMSENNIGAIGIGLVCTPFDFTGDLTVCTGDTAHITVLNQGVWNSSDPEIAMVGAEGQIVGVDAGSVFIFLTDENTNCIDSIEFTVFPLPNTEVSTNDTYCEGDDLELFASGGTSYNWSGPGGFSSSDQNPVIFDSDATMSGTYSVTVTDLNGCSAQTELELQINANPAVEIDNTGPYCEGASIELSVSEGFFYNWNGPEGFNSTEHSPVIINATTSMSGTYSVVVSDANGCSTEVNTEVEVNTLPHLIISQSEPSCESSSLWLDAGSSSQGPQYSYQWSTIGGNIVTSTDSTAIEVNASGRYFLEITNLENGCAVSDSVEVELELPDLEITANAQSSFCAGGELQLTAGPEGLDSYEWSGPGDFFSNERNPLIESAGVEYAGTYELFATLGGCEYRAEVEVVIFPLPEFDYIVDSILCEGEAGFIEIIDVSGGQSPYTYSFTQAGDFSSNPLAGPLQPGVYLLRVRDARGCSNEDIPTVVLEDGPPCEQNCEYDLKDIYLEVERYDRQTVNVLDENQLSTPYFLSTVSAGSELITGLEFDESGSIFFSVTGNFVDLLPIRYRICHPSCDNCSEATIYLSNRQLQDIVQTSVITPDQPTNRFLQFSEEPVEGSELWIYNRWGDQVFHSRNYQNDWDAEGFPGGVYFYVFRVYGYTIKSSLTVIR